MSLLIRSRLFTCVVFGVVGLCFLWKFSESAFDVGAGFIALGLWSSNPYVLGHGATIMPDVPSAELAVAAVYCFWQWLRQPDFGNAFLSGVVLGLAELTKFTLLIFYPLFVLLWLIYRLPERKSPIRNKFRSQILQLGVLFAVSLFVVNMGYLFEGTGKPLGSFKFQTTLLTGCQTLKDVPTGGGNRFADDAWGKNTVPLPANYIQGADTQRFDFERGSESYLRGMVGSRLGSLLSLRPARQNSGRNPPALPPCDRLYLFSQRLQYAAARRSAHAPSWRRPAGVCQFADGVFRSFAIRDPRAPVFFPLGEQSRSSVYRNSSTDASRAK